MRKYVCAIVALLSATMLAACGGSKAGASSTASLGASGSTGRNSEFKIGEMVWQGPLFYPFNSWNQTGQIESLVIQKLVEIGQNGQPKLGLASSAEHPNPTTYIYNIRQGVRFSDGKPLTMADVLYSLELDKDKLFYEKEAWENIASISARGTSAVVIKLKRPSLDWTNIMVMASEIFEKSSIDKAKESELGSQSGLPIGTGPWKYDSYIPESSVQLSRNPYWSGLTQPDAKISFTIFKNEAEMALALRSGAIDAASTYESQKLFTNIPNIHQLAGTQNWMTWMSMNTSKPPLNNVHVRRAIAYATNVDAMLKALYPEHGASPDPSVIPVPLFANYGSSSQVSQMFGTLSKYEFNLSKARQELVKSPYPHGFTEELTYFVGEPLLLSIAQIISADLNKVGITLRIKPLQADEATQQRTVENMYLNDYITIIPNAPDILMSSLLSPANVYPAGNQNNWASYSDSALGKGLAELTSATEPKTRLRLAGQSLRIAAAEEPYLPLFMHSTFMAVSNRYVSPPLSFDTTAYEPWMLDMKLAK